MGEDGFVMEQVSLSIETDHLTTSTEAWVDAHDALLSQGSTKEQLAQVLGKDADGLLVGLLFAQSGELGFYGGFKQTFVAVLHGLGDKS